MTAGAVGLEVRIDDVIIRSFGAQTCAWARHPGALPSGGAAWKGRRSGHAGGRRDGDRVGGGDEDMLAPLIGPSRCRLGRGGRIDRLLCFKPPQSGVTERTTTPALAAVPPPSPSPPMRRNGGTGWPPWPPWRLSLWLVLCLAASAALAAPVGTNDTADADALTVMVVPHSHCDRTSAISRLQCC